MTRSLHPSPVPAPPWPGSVHTPTPTPPPWSRVCHSSFLRTVSAHLLPHSPSSLQQQPRQVQVSILTPLAHPSHSCHNILSGGISEHIFIFKEALLEIFNLRQDSQDLPQLSFLPSALCHLFPSPTGSWLLQFFGDVRQRLGTLLAFSQNPPRSYPC